MSVKKNDSGAVADAAVAPARSRRCALATAIAACFSGGLGVCQGMSKESSLSSLAPPLAPPAPRLSAGGVCGLCQEREQGRVRLPFGTAAAAAMAAVKPRPGARGERGPWPSRPWRRRGSGLRQRRGCS